MAVFVLSFGLLFLTSMTLAAVDISAPETFIIGSGAIEIQCTPYNNGSGLNVMNTLRISRNSSEVDFGTPASRVVSVTRVTGSVITWHNTAVQSRATITGSADDVTSSFLRLVISSTRCEDSTTYRCEMEALDDQFNPVNVANDSNIMASVAGTRMEAIGVTILSGSKVGDTYTNNTLVRFDCVGNVGSPPANIRWCIKRASDEYTEVTSNVTHNMATVDNTTCQYRRSSMFMYVFEYEDDLSEVVCEPDTMAGCGTSNLRSVWQLRPAVLSGGNRNGMTVFTLMGCLLLAAFS